MSNLRLNRLERRTALSLSGVFFVRMLGVFMPLSVLAVAASSFPGATAILVGLALGIVGLTQAIMQLPFGILSDRIGRKPAIVVGLLIFIAGSVIAASSESIHQVILGRALQGVGAISAATMALAADLVRARQRSRVSMFIGLAIGTAFFLAFLVAPLLLSNFGLQGVFYFVALGGGVALFLVLFAVPNPGQTGFQKKQSDTSAGILRWLFHKQLMKFHVGIFVLHATLVANFMVLPFVLRDQFHFPLVEHWKFYIPLLGLSFLLVFPLLKLAEKKSKFKLFFLINAFLLSFAQLLFFVVPSDWLWLLLAGLIFFVAFNFFEASLPALVSRVAPEEFRGTCLGVFTSCQFAGIFVGGLVAGLIQSYVGTGFPSLFGFVLCSLWLLFLTSVKEPPLRHSNRE